ncbi:glycerol-3-phosphate acyltransferase PlsY [Streptomyces sp. LBL]|uniref:glycerol-3-phosphate acyltransferase n=1 Tax=Streptomyces sp. LBL TaxID=2940562 RepID=UPI002474B9DD|nr:glycerol-3-phosphate acyltransferase [Streptomyces sp. LBL]MDH6629910.1 glycerol-3-phosphate acyltransferase PlsY [Streptomyces sp. LBL]
MADSVVFGSTTRVGPLGEGLWRAGCSFLIGALPSAHLVAKYTLGVDLRAAHPESVSATGTYRAAGLAPFLIVSALDVAKGYVATRLAGRSRRSLALHAALVVAGHNWSPFLRGAGGRGITPATGALLCTHWKGAVVVLGGPALGYVCRETGLGAFASQFLLLSVASLSRERRTALPSVAAVLVPMWAKRILGNELEIHPNVPVARYVERLLYDRDD